MSPSIEQPSQDEMLRTSAELPAEIAETGNATALSR